MSKKEIKYEEYSQDNQEIEYNQSSQDEFNQDCDYGEEGEGRNDLLVLAESLGEVVGIDNPELLIKVIIKAVKSGKTERLTRGSVFSILFNGRLKLLEIYQLKEGVGIIPLSRDVIDQLRQYA